MWHSRNASYVILCAEKLDSLNSALLASALASSKPVGFVNGLRRFYVPISPSRRYLCFMMRQLNQWVPPCDIPLLSIARSFPQIPKGHEKNEIDRVVSCAHTQQTSALQLMWPRQRKLSCARRQRAGKITSATRLCNRLKLGYLKTDLLKLKYSTLQYDKSVHQNPRDWYSRRGNPKLNLLNGLHKAWCRNSSQPLKITEIIITPSDFQGFQTEQNDTKGIFIAACGMAG